MDNRPANTFLTKTEGNASRIFSLSAEDNEAHRSVRQTCTPIKIKEEDTSDEIQEYAATTMSELLGWYGYDKVDSGCTRSLNLDHFTSTPSTKSSKGHQMNHKFSSNRETSKSPVSINMNSSAFEFPGIALPYSINNLTTKRQFTSSPLSLKKVPLDSTSTFAFTSFGGSACLDNVISCSWCGRITQRCESGRSNTFPYNMINTLGHFCSEACFAAGRRAVFKQAKMCDWCRHLRNPISYADFQDGESQLQFCSDKCLNQYKMNIFCHETQTHLMLHGLNNISFHDTEKSSLITPELWFRNCQSPLHSPTEGTFLVDEHLISNLSASSNDKKEMGKEQMEIEKSIESNRKVTRKKDSFCIQKCIKTNNCNEKKNLSTVINKGGINEENKFCHFMSNQSHCRISCSEKSAIDYKDFKKTCNLLDVTNYNSYNCQRNSVILSENNIHVKDIKNLQEEKEEVLSKEMLKSTSCFATSTTSTTPYKISLPSKPFTDESNDTEYEKQANVTLRASPRLSCMQSNQIKSSVHSLPTTLLPPVTVLVPHPIPIPIPIPIPVPVPTSFLRKLMNDGQKVSLGDKDSKCIDSIENKCLVLGESKVTTNTNVATQTTEHIPTAKFYSSSTSDSKEDNDNLHSLEHNTKPPRKRKRSNESINYKHEELPLKRMNKFIVA